MADRHFWGTSKMDKVRVREYLDLDEQSEAPPARTGRLYLNDSGNLLICNDGTNFVVVGAQS
jgi:hypothetical protein